MAYVLQNTILEFECIKVPEAYWCLMCLKTQRMLQLLLIKNHMLIALYFE